MCISINEYFATILYTSVHRIMHSWILRHALFNGMVATLMVATGTIHTLVAK